MKNALLTVGAVAVLGAAMAFAWSGEGAEPEVDATARTEAPTEEIPVLTSDAKFGLDEDELTDEEKRNSIVLPGGLRLPALNGCTNTESLGWPVWTSRSPVVELVHGPSYDMYKHEDGTLTTTQMVKYPDGNWAPAAVHMKPVEAQPTFEFNKVKDKQRIPGK